jgi:L-aspartate oxidase
VHGANRLASNSLLEGLVFGARVANDIRGQNAARKAGDAPMPHDGYAAGPVPMKLRQAMSRHVGIERDAAGLRTALAVIDSVERAGNGDPALLNVTAAAKLAAAAALAREESRGGHFRSDYPETSERARRTFLTLADAERIAATAEGVASGARTANSAR